MEYNKDKKEIILNRKLNELDKFVLDFIKIIEKHVDYVIISGYVSILLGRSRATEDVDVFIKKISYEKFLEIYRELINNGFECLNSNDTGDIFDYLNNKLAIRFARKGKSIPNFEVKFPKNNVDEDAFDDSIVVVLKQGKLKISSLERHIAFKRYFLKSDKDIEDALHVEELFELDYGKVNKLKEVISKL